MGWTWKDGTPSERAEMVRRHGRIPNLPFLSLCRLFGLTANGAWEILKGGDWRPEYSLEAERARRLELIRLEALRHHGKPYYCFTGLTLSSYLDKVRDAWAEQTNEQLLPPEKAE